MMDRWMVFLVVVGLYFLPFGVATSRRHPHVLGIFVLNLLLGWIVLGWVGALIWACVSPRPTAALRSAVDAETRRACPHCAELIKPLASVCRFCNRPVPILRNTAGTGSNGAAGVRTATALWVVISVAGATFVVLYFVQPLQSALP